MRLWGLETMQDEALGEPGRASSEPGAEREAPDTISDEVAVQRPEVREALGALIRLPYDHAKAKKTVRSWQEFAVRILYEDDKDLEAGERVRNLERVAIE